MSASTCETRRIPQLRTSGPGELCLTHERLSVWCLLEASQARVKELEAALHLPGTTCGWEPATKKLQERVKDLEAALESIVLRYVPALTRDAIEPDKTNCHAQGIRGVVVRALPGRNYP